jgi:putative tRNA adenosine deaminase-associated protein
VSYFAVAVARGPKGWSATELDLGRPSDAEDVAELLRDHDTEADISLLFVEADDEYLTILRLDEGEDLRIFGSDAAFADESRLGAVLLADLERPDLIDIDGDYEDGDSADDDAGDTPDLGDSEPVGDADLLSDLGIPAKRLTELCAKEGLLPTDVTAEICAVLGCAEDVEELR